jgi:para-aminobenzoate synthetase / 4-amino-4-deoxychorismate lyase
MSAEITVFNTMMNSTPDFDLIETLRWSRGQGYFLLERHLDRLVNSASELGFTCHRTDVLKCLDNATADFTGLVERVRILLHLDGHLTLTHTPIALPEADDIMVFAVSEKTVDSRDDLYRHKTTRRELFDGERLELQKLTGCDEVIFTNERAEVTEGSITTVFVEKSGVLKTPPVSSGLLPGTLRAKLIADEKIKIKETVLTLTDLASADSIFLGNSVRGLIKARQV